MTQSNPLRVGLIGAGGRWGPRAHVPALKGVSEAELYAVCTAHADTAQAAADKFGVTGAYGNDKALHADREVEAVAVAVQAFRDRRAEQPHIVIMPPASPFMWD